MKILDLPLKYLYSLAPLTRLFDEIELVCDRHDINRHNSNSVKVIVTKTRVECSRNSFKYSVVSCMNVLNSVIEGFLPQIYKLIYYILYEHLSNLVAMVSN